MNVNQQQRAQQPPYIGSKISLISKLDIRYEGTLYTVDAIESTIALAKVRSYGTEDRHTPVFVPPRDEVYDFIIFKASDIKDLIVCELPKISGTHSQLVTGLPYDPAIVSISKNPPPEPKLPTKLNNMNYSKSAEVPKRLGEFERDYDFEKANEQFRVEEKSGERLQKGEMGQWMTMEKKLMTMDNDGEEALVFYNKSTSFFDNISCDALEKEAGKNVRPDWKRERQTNQETFGHSAVRSLFFQRRGSAVAARGGGAHHNYGGARAYGTARVYPGNRGYNGSRGYGGSLGYGSALVYGGALGYGGGGGTLGYGGAR